MSTPWQKTCHGAHAFAGRRRLWSHSERQRRPGNRRAPLPAKNPCSPERQNLSEPVAMAGRDSSLSWRRAENGATWHRVPGTRPRTFHPVIASAGGAKRSPTRAGNSFVGGRRLLAMTDPRSSLATGSGDPGILRRTGRSGAVAKRAPSPTPAMCTDDSGTYPGRNLRLHSHSGRSIIGAARGPRARPLPPPTKTGPATRRCSAFLGRAPRGSRHPGPTEAILSPERHATRPPHEQRSLSASGQRSERHPQSTNGGCERGATALRRA